MTINENFMYNHKMKFSPKNVAHVYKNWFFIFSLKHPAKYIGKKPRKYTIPAKPLGPQQSSMNATSGDQVRIYKSNSAISGAGGMGSLQQNSQYQRVR